MANLEDLKAGARVRGLSPGGLAKVVQVEWFGDQAVILDEVFASLPTPPFTADEKKAVATDVYAHVWQQAVSGEFARAA